MDPSPQFQRNISHHSVKAICWPTAKMYGIELLLEKLLLMHLVKKFTAYLKLKVHFHAHKGQHLDLILHQINSVHTFLLIFLTSTFILSFHLQCLSLSSNLFSSDFQTKILEVFLYFPFLLHPLPFSSSLISSLYKYMASSINSEDSHYAIFKLAHYFRPLALPPPPPPGITILGEPSLFQNCPPLFLVLWLTSPVPHPHILSNFLTSTKVFLHIECFLV